MQKADKGNTIVVTDKDVYKKKKLSFQIVLNLKNLTFKKKSI